MIQHGSISPRITTILAKRPTKWEQPTGIIVEPTLRHGLTHAHVSREKIVTFIIRNGGAKVCGAVLRFFPRWRITLFLCHGQNGSICTLPLSIGPSANITGQFTAKFEHKWTYFCSFNISNGRDKSTFMVYSNYTGDLILGSRVSLELLPSPKQSV